MSELEPKPEAQPAAESDGAPTEGQASKTISPMMAGLVLLVLMMFFYGLSQYTEYFGGPQYEWGQNLDDALIAAENSGRRVFLFLYEPGCIYTAQYDRELFSKRFARNRLSAMIPIRIELAEDDPLRVRFSFRTSPMMIMLGGDGKIIGTPLVGSGIDERQFLTRIHPTDER